MPVDRTKHSRKPPQSQSPVSRQENRQAELFHGFAHGESNADEEDPAFVTEQLITYIGNKRGLLDFIGQAVHRVQQRLSRRRLEIADLFSGSGVVARYLKRFASRLVVNDLESYCRITNLCYLANRSELEINTLKDMHADLLHRLETQPLREGLISRHYAPRNDENIRPGERVFYTSRNARYLDTARSLITELPAELQPFFLGPLIAEASIHANTSGVFKGFYKDSSTGVGKFGGNNGDALRRILGSITLPFPIFSRFECDVEVHTMDVNRLVPQLEPLDLVYLDPPYNQHPYGSNYFMLNLLAEYRTPQGMSKVSGIPTGWNRSAFNKRRHVLTAFRRLVHDIPARFLLVSFNSEGFIDRDTMLQILEEIGRVEVMETTYNTFRGSRNLRNREIHVKEYLYLVEVDSR